MDEQEALLRERLSAFVRQIPIISAGHLTLAALTTWVLWGCVAGPLLLGWAACVAAIATARLHDWRRPLPATAGELRAFERRVVLLASAAGGVWGTAVLFCFPCDDATRQLFLTAALIGLAGGAVAALPAVYAACVTFLPYLASRQPFSGVRIRPEVGTGEAARKRII